MLQRTGKRKQMVEANGSRTPIALWILQLTDYKRGGKCQKVRLDSRDTHHLTFCGRDGPECQAFTN
jgi:hypothetical protein